MIQLSYDGSFAGFLTAVFEAYEHKYDDCGIVRLKAMQGLSLAGNHSVATDPAKARRVLSGLEAKLSRGMMKSFYWCFLSELPEIETVMLQFCRYVFASRQNVEGDFGNPHVLMVAQTAKKVGREKHRFEAFVRFERTDNDLYFAPVNPDFNVLPVIAPHFVRRYPSQSWVIYDTRRRYGIHYDKGSETLDEVMFEAESGFSVLAGMTDDPGEARSRNLWRAYFGSINIGERKNTKLHLRHMPKRYWKYLVEKTPERE